MQLRRPVVMMMTMVAEDVEHCRQHSTGAVGSVTRERYLPSDEAAGRIARFRRWKFAAPDTASITFTWHV